MITISPSLYGVARLKFRLIRVHVLLVPSGIFWSSTRNHDRDLEYARNTRKIYLSVLKILITDFNTTIHFINFFFLLLFVMTSVHMTRHTIFFFCLIEMTALNFMTQFTIKYYCTS